MVKDTLNRLFVEWHEDKMALAKSKRHDYDDTMQDIGLYIELLRAYLEER